MRIGELAKRADVSVRSLRYYEEQGLLESERTTGGHREYRESDVARVRFMQMLYAAGMPSRRIIELLPFLDTGVATPRMLDHFDEESERIRRQIEALTATHTRLARLREIAAESVAGRPPSECRSSANAAAA
ncbi:MerR family transcriptional regulator [Herbiconiux sp. VKM Ac-2851]|uniref:MerR family transcriptional regulator n=1 Tax=Herbiconiux sp. VKM Ac-2851 TaxID=2739025 RepID=UPI001567A0D9|nr:MerR family transcriptional regulator [Herbiconiux sp. VKM Ac-2851]NQX35539.1 MerR family transcriptional regulator [Herbiconiux sp. VKM Ac-2851]